MKATRRPLFLVDVDEAADYLFTEAGEIIALRWRDELKRTLKSFPKSADYVLIFRSKISALFK
jgi:hypothetical protein